MLTVLLAAGCGTAAAALAAGPFGRRPPGVRSTAWREAGEQADVPTNAVRLRAAGSWMPPALSVIATVMMGIRFGPVAACAVAVGAVAARRALRRAAVRRLRTAQGAQAEEVLSALATELEAGRNPAEALRAAVSDLAEASGRTLTPRTAITTGNRIDDPLSLEAELAHRADPITVLARCEASTLRQLAAAWRVSQNAGIPLAPMANRLAAVVRAEREQNGEVSAALAGPRASGRLVASLPVAGIVLGAFVGAAPLDVLLTTPAGTACLAVGMTLDLAGLAWINRLTETAERHIPTSDDPERGGNGRLLAGLSR